MAIEMTCPGCDTVYPVSDDLAGKTIRCKKCGEMMTVAAAAIPKAKPVTAKAVPAKAIPAKPARPVSRDDDDDVPARGRSAQREEAPPKKKSALPLILGGIVGFLVLGGIGIAGLVMTGLLDGNPQPTDQNIAQNTTPSSEPAPNDVPNKGTKALASPDKSTEKPDAGTKDDGKKPAILPTPVPTTVKTPETTTNSPPAPGSRTKPDPIGLSRAKTAAVFIEVETNTVKATGSGWFGLEENLVFTNAHVLSMKNPGSAKPKKVTIYINPGTNQERIIPHSRIEILAVDRSADLAVMKILNETNLPVPLKIRPSSELTDLEPLVVIGYPGGRLFSRMNDSTRAPQATVNTTSFSTNRINDNGELYSVQIRGGAGPGNSGGPIIDYDGNVIAVLVSGPKDAVFAASTCFGVPTEYVSGLLAGRVADVEYGQAYRKDGKIRIPVTANVLDPFQRMKEVGVGVWVGDVSTKKRAPGKERTGMEPSDSDFKEVKLTYKYAKDKQIATGELVFPEAQSGRAYWVQPYYSNSIQPKYWLPGSSVKLNGPPVDLEDVDLLVRYKIGSKRPITLTTSNDLEEFEVGEGSQRNERVMVDSEYKGQETVGRSPEAASASAFLLKVNYDKLAVKATNGEDKVDILPKLFPKVIRDIMEQSLKQTQSFGYVKANGEIYKTNSDLRGAGKYAPAIKFLSDEAMDVLQNASIPLPNGRVKPQQTWQSIERVIVLPVTFISSNTNIAPQAPGTEPPPADEGGIPGTGPGRRAKKVTEYRFAQQLTYTYLGTRTRIGQKEAVIRIEGTIKPAAGTSAASGATGVVKGFAYVDLDTGTIIESELHREFEMDSSADGVKRLISGIENFKLSRGAAQ